MCRNENQRTGIAVFIASLLVLASISLVHGEEDDDPVYLKGCVAFKERDYTNAVKHFESAAAKGHLPAKWMLGQCNEEGMGVSPNPSKAFEIMKELEVAGYTDALLSLGYYYQQGIGVRPDQEIAHKYYIMASEKGNARAMLNCGLDYTSGAGVEKDSSMAIRFFDKVIAEREDAEITAEAEFWKAVCMISESKNGDQRVEGLKVMLSSAEHGCWRAQEELGHIYSGNVKSAYTKNPDIQEALRWYRAAAAQGSIDSAKSVRILYDIDGSVPEGYVERSEWYKKLVESEFREAADRGDATAQLRLGELHAFGHHHLPVNYDEAIRWCKMSSSNGNGPASALLGRIFLTLNKSKDALEYYEIAISQGDLDGELRCKVAMLYYKGFFHVPVMLGESERTAQDNMALSMLDSARKEGIGKAAYLLGLLYTEAKYNLYTDIKTDLPKAKSYFREAKKLGFAVVAEAKKELDQLHNERAKLGDLKDLNEEIRNTPLVEPLYIQENGRMVPGDENRYIESLDRAVYGSARMKLARLRKVEVDIAAFKRAVDCIESLEEDDQSSVAP